MQHARLLRYATSWRKMDRLDRSSFETAFAARARACLLERELRINIWGWPGLARKEDLGNKVGN